MANARMETRLAWIEAALRAGGQFPGHAYRNAFGISRQTQSDDFNEFAARMKEMGISCLRSHGRLSVDLPARFVFEPMDPRGWTRDVAPDSVFGVTAPRLTEPGQTTLRVALEAIRDHVAVRCEYTSLTSGTRRALLSPHALVEAVGREHVRAFDHEKNVYRDYTLSRMSNTSLDSGVAYVGRDGDEDWLRIVTVVLKPVVDLSTERRLAVLLGLDALEEGEKTFSCRAALVNYAIQSLGFMPERYVAQLEVEIIS